MSENPDPVVDRVAWALHCWSCPLCHENGIEAMSSSGQDHVTETDRAQASFLVGALGLRQSDERGSR